MARRAAKRGYHHGDLRRALLATGIALLEGKVDGELGLRELAREVGVSATAVYRHFPDKDTLFAALAAEGFERLAETQLEAAARHRDQRRAFRAMGQAYVHFALLRPALFRLMTSHMRLSGPSGEVGDNRAKALLRSRVAALLPKDATDAQREIAVVQAWALVHGLAVLVLGGQIPRDAALIDAAVDEFRL